jgi:hypothetical protein
VAAEQKIKTAHKLAELAVETGRFVEFKILF